MDLLDEDDNDCSEFQNIVTEEDANFLPLWNQSTKPQSNDTGLTSRLHNCSAIDEEDDNQEQQTQREEQKSRLQIRRDKETNQFWQKHAEKINRQANGVLNKAKNQDQFNQVVNSFAVYPNALELLSHQLLQKKYVKPATSQLPVKDKKRYFVTSAIENTHKVKSVAKLFEQLSDQEIMKWDGCLQIIQIKKEEVQELTDRYLPLQFNFKMTKRKPELKPDIEGDKIKLIKALYKHRKRYFNLFNKFNAIVDEEALKIEEEQKLQISPKKKPLIQHPKIETRQKSMKDEKTKVLSPNVIQAKKQNDEPQVSYGFQKNASQNLDIRKKEVQRSQYETDSPNFIRHSSNNNVVLEGYSLNRKDVVKEMVGPEKYKNDLLELASYFKTQKVEQNTQKQSKLQGNQIMIDTMNNYRELGRMRNNYLRETNQEASQKARQRYAINPQVIPHSQSSVNVVQGKQNNHSASLSQSQQPSGKPVGSVLGSHIETTARVQCPSKAIQTPNQKLREQTAQGIRTPNEPPRFILCSRGNTVRRPHHQYQKVFGKSKLDPRLQPGFWNRSNSNQPFQQAVQEIINADYELVQTDNQPEQLHRDRTQACATNEFELTQSFSRQRMQTLTAATGFSLKQYASTSLTSGREEVRELLQQPNRVFDGSKAGQNSKLPLTKQQIQTSWNMSRGSTNQTQRFKGKGSFVLLNLPGSNTKLVEQDCQESRVQDQLLFNQWKRYQEQWAKKWRISAPSSSDARPSFS